MKRRNDTKNMECEKTKKVCVFRWQGYSTFDLGPMGKFPNGTTDSFLHTWNKVKIGISHMYFLKDIAWLDPWICLPIVKEVKCAAYFFFKFMRKYIVLFLREEEDFKWIGARYNEVRTRTLISVRMKILLFVSFSLTLCSRDNGEPEDA